MVDTDQVKPGNSRHLHLRQRDDDVLVERRGDGRHAAEYLLRLLQPEGLSEGR